MAFEYDAENSVMKCLIEAFKATGAQIIMPEKTTKTSFQKSQDDIKSGRITTYKNTDDFFKKSIIVMYIIRTTKTFDADVKRCKNVVMI